MIHVKHVTVKFSSLGILKQLNLNQNDSIPIENFRCVPYCILPLEADENFSTQFFNVFKSQRAKGYCHGGNQ